MKTVVSFVFLTLLLCLCTLTAAADKPNVIVIISDDQGWADIGYNNPERAYTPRLDRLAREGATFANHYVMPQCTPTRVCAMTGRYPGRFGPQALHANNNPVFPKGTPTLAHMFQECGYETFLCGKWHLGSSPDHGPNHFGFDESYGSLAGAIGMYDHRYRKGKYEYTWHRNHKLIEGSENGIHATDLVAGEAVRFIERKRQQPFFLYLSFHAVHTSLDERGRFVDQPTRLDPQNPGRWQNEDKIKWFNDPEGRIQSEPDPEKRLLLAAAYHLDHAIGQVVDALERTGQRENTLILFSSDNGPQGSWGGNAYPDDLKLTDFNQPIPLRGKKLDVWEGGILVPGFAVWPKRIDANKTITDRTHIIDWFPTLASLLAYRPEQPIPWDGVDLAPVIFDDESLEERDLYFQQRNRWALRFGDWKIVKYGGKIPRNARDWQLYNLKNDPKETDNIADRHPEILSDLHRRFLVHRSKDRKRKDAADREQTRLGKQVRPFFAFDNGLRQTDGLEEKAALLAQLGYDGIAWRPGKTAEMLETLDRHGLKMFATYVTLSADKEACRVPLGVVREIEALKGRDTIVWLTIGGKTSDEVVVEGIRRVCGVARENGLQVALYPHNGYYTDTTAKTLELAQKADRPNLGVSFNLCHFLKQNDASQLEEVLRAAADELLLVSINGADGGETRRMGWDRLIRPLGEGTFDVAKVMRILDEIGYDGPVGLQCFNIKGEDRENLKESMSAWKRMHRNNSRESAGFVHSNIHLDQAEIGAVKAKVRTGVEPWKHTYDALLHKADEFLNKSPVSITDNGGGNGYQDPEDMHTGR